MSHYAGLLVYYRYVQTGEFKEEFLMYEFLKMTTKQLII